MSVIDNLKSLGADVQDGLGRCMGNEAFYLRMVGMVLADKNFDELEAAARDGDLERAFHAAHALKGVTGNVSLTPIYKEVSEVTENLRAKVQMDYVSAAQSIQAKRKQFKESCGL